MTQFCVSLVTRLTQKTRILRIAIVHHDARWNKTLKACGVKDSNIIVQSVPGSFELPFACSNFGGSSTSLPSNKEPSAPTSTLTNIPNAPFDAVVAIGVLIKGSTMHFEYICDSVSHALMKIQIDTGVPVIFGVLTALTEDQALERAGLGRKAEKGHNHDEDWGLASRVDGSTEQTMG
ncbi:dimethylribityllumazine synthase [Suillus bovinus]|uniref:dimethylribityllumazine synthase n=1 Tax=Suillus bovinus TaxID=48563 RepID=UPI001B872DE2|nr:dimethylribityllumazine synthase [Suillus bovinus]KAG2147436.1 dimethylribityllumazine synthase [Suillus bovinus]